MFFCTTLLLETFLTRLILRFFLLTLESCFTKLFRFWLFLLTLAIFVFYKIKVL